MGRDKEVDVDVTSAEFKQGVEAGLNSEEDTKNWKAGNELGRELREEGETKAPVYGQLHGGPPTPLLMSSRSDGLHRTARDEKDGTG